MKTPLLISAMVFGAALAGQPALAEQHGERPDFATLDLDGNGALSAEEMAAAATARFAAADTDGDGAVSAEELAAAHSDRRAARMVERLDTNEDGLLQQAELQEAFANRSERMFERLDRDDDGAISAEEFENAREHGRRGGKGHKHGHGGRG